MRSLEHRSERILKAIVTEYIATGEPVGSRTISKVKEIGLSAATIRNIMSDLTELGYIIQPHISAGRIPTDLGYRFYVDSLVKTQGALSNERMEIEYALGSDICDYRDIFKQTSTVLAGFSKQAGVAAATYNVEENFKSIEFIKIADDRILVILVSSTGTVHNKIIFDEDETKQETLDRFSRMLNDMLKDLDLEEARTRIEHELATEKSQVDAMLVKSLRLCHAILSLYESTEVFVDGQIYILDDPELAQIEKLRAILTTFEDKSRLLRILDKTLRAEGIQILIGAEHGVDEIGACSIIAYPIKTDDKIIGSIGVIGPKRMNYSKTISIVGTTAGIVNKLIKRVVDSN